ncbi:MAG: UvrD-helicase domain-containing protein [Pseudomonadota bacterium]
MAKQHPVSTASLIESDQAARLAALDTARSFIVQAPAGSGKTELLIQRYLRLLAAVEEPEEVLAITFTVKAAAEMRVRVLAALAQASANEVPDTDFRRITYEAARKVLQQSEKYGWNLSANARRLRIQTMDALNASIARAQPVTARGAAGSRLLAEAEARQLYRQAAAATLDHLSEEGEHRRAIQRVLTHVDNNTYTYIENLANMLARRDQWLPFVADGAIDADNAATLRQRFEQTLSAAIAVQLQNVVTQLTDSQCESLTSFAAFAGSNLRDTNKVDHPVAALAEIREFPQPSAENVALWRGFSHLCLIASSPYSWRKTVTVRDGFPKEDKDTKQRFLELINDLKTVDGLDEQWLEVRSLPDPHYEDEQWDALVALMRLLPLAAVELRRLFGQQGFTDYIEVAMNAAAALGEADNPGKVALLLDVQLKHLLVDEMQDTSSAQYRMLETLTGGWEPGDGRTLFCVGDPMQSIYRFRNAEVGQFLLAREAGIGAVNLEPLTLRRNFRSGAGLVDWFNDTFAAALPSQDNATLSAVSYSMAAGVEHQAGLGTEHWYPMIGSDVAAEAGQTVAVVESLLEGTDGDIAILVRSRTQLPELLRQLHEHQITYRAVDVHRLTDRAEIIDVLALTRAILHRGDRLAWLAILRSPWAGLDWVDLQALVHDSSSATVAQLVATTERLAKLSEAGQQAARRVVDVIETSNAEAATKSLRHRVERCWYALGGPALLSDEFGYANVQFFLDTIENLSVGGGLNDVARLEQVLDREYVSQSGSARVQIMTMHKAKGLQFDHVVLPSLGRVSGRADSAMLNWLDLPTGRGGEDKLLSVVGATADIDRDPIHGFLQRFDRIKQRHELARLLYVACTRAKQSLHLIGHAVPDSSGERLKTPTKGTLLGLLWPAAEERFQATFEASGKFAADMTDPDWVLPQRRVLQPQWEAPSFVPPVGLETTAVAENEPQSSFEWVGAEARVAGVAVHRWLQLAADGRAELASAATATEITREWLSRAGLLDEQLDVAADRVATALRGVASDPKGQWLVSGDGEAELALTGSVDGAPVNVVIDRVRIDADGTHWIVDYKTSSHEGGNLKGFIDAETSRYRTQLETYAKIYQDFSGVQARCALYFPLLQEFVEVEL